MLSGICDNWVFLERINLVKWRSKFEEDWVDWGSTAFTIGYILLSMMVKLRDIYRETLKRL